MTRSMSFCFSSPRLAASSFRLTFSRVAINSTMITAPSMMIPKSRAPRLIRLASILKIYIMEIVNRRERGMIEAMTRPDRRLPSRRMTTAKTIRQPRIRFSRTVWEVFFDQFGTFNNGVDEDSFGQGFLDFGHPLFDCFNDLV